MKLAAILPRLFNESKVSSLRPSAVRRGVTWLALAALALFAAAPRASAQNIEFTQGSTSSTTMTLQVPLRSYPGRGTASLPVTLYYSSSLWRIGYNKSVRLNSGIRNAVAEATYAEHSTAGWTTSLDVPKVEWPRFNDLYWYDGKPYFNSIQPYTYRVANVFIHMPDGSTHELRKSDQVYQNLGAVDTSGTFHAVDGSRLRYDSTGPTTGTLYMPDGSRYVLNGSTAQFIDRNGNTLGYDASTRQWTDTLGRVISTPWPANPQPGDQPYTLPGFNGAAITYTLKWRNLSQVLSPDAQGQTPPLKAASSHYLPFPNQPPTDQNSNNFPQPSGMSSLFFSDYGQPDADNPDLSYTYVVGRGQEAGQVFNPVVLAEIVLPDGTSYKFSYNVYGEIEKVVYPTGGYQRYQHGTVAPMGRSAAPYNQASRGMNSRWVSPKGTGGADEALWQYQASVPFLHAYRVRVIAPDNTRTDTYLHNFLSGTTNFGYGDARNGKTFDEQKFDAAGVMLRRTLTEWAQSSATFNKPNPTSTTFNSGTYTAHRNARAVKSVKIILDTGGNALTSAALYGYDLTYQFLTGVELTSSSEYHFAATDQTTAQSGLISAMPIGALARTTETSYLTWNSAYRGRQLLGLLTSEVVRDASGVIVARKEILYDEATYPLLTYPSVVGWSNPQTTARGNATTVRNYSDPSAGSYLETHTQYDQCGGARNMWDAHVASAPNHGHMTQVEYSPTYHYAYATRNLTPVPDPSGAYGSTTALETLSAYDFTTGLPTSMTDANGFVTTLSYADDAGVLDPLLRLRRLTRPSGGGWTKFNYGYSNNAGLNNRYVETVTALDASRSTISYQFYDGLGRPNRTFVYVGPNSFDTADTQYDVMGRVLRASQHYRTTGSPVAIPADAKWTTTAYDAIGRVRTVTTPDGAVIETTYSGNEVTVRDQAGKRRRTRSDALGRMIAVIEDPLGAALQTDYIYDVLGNLRSVQQGTQRRYYMYDALSRPLRVRNPEQAVNASLGGTDPVTGNTQWSLGYAYDLYGNLQTRTDPRNVTATYTYDNLNRHTRTQYSDGTPQVEQSYDTYFRGRLWRVSNGGDVAEDGNFDSLGRPRLRRQWFFDGTSWRYYDVTCAYNLAGGVTSETYPSGHTTTYQYDAAGRTSHFAGTLGDGVSRVYSTGIAYDEAGRMKQEQFGTQTPVYNKSYYNVRGQLSEIRVATTPNDTFWNRGAIINHYSDQSWAGSGTDNNGNLRKQDIYIPNDEAISGFSLTTFFYYYDALNRLDLTSEVRNGANSFVQDYDYDRYGNRTINAANTWGNGVGNKQFAVDAGTNRLGVPAGQPGVMQYDAAGNLVADTYSAAAVSRAYDAEGRMTQETTYNNAVAGRYTYDGAGRRVRRFAGGQEWWYVYGVGGELVAEYGAGFIGSAVQQEYGYRGGELLVTATPNGSQGLQAQYYNSLNFTNPALTRTDPTVNFEWHAASPGPGVNADIYTARWTGYVTPRYSQTYTFYTQTDDGVRLWVNDQLVVDKWIDQGWTEWSGQITLEANKRYSIRMEFYENFGGAISKLFWSSASQAKEIIPASQLTPPQGATVKWLVTDQQGTPRMALDQTGALARVTRHDYLPFGEELRAGAGGRTYQQGYLADGTRQQFTGHERDGETGLDFMKSRFYSNAQGRFTSPDAVAGNKINPQSLNLYGYVINNPVKYSDPTGHMPADVGWGDVSNGFWGSSVIPMDPRFGGMGIIWERMAERDRAISDSIQARRINNLIEEGKITREEAEELIKDNDNLSIEEVTSTVVESGIEDEGGGGEGNGGGGAQESPIPDKNKDPMTYTLLAVLVGEATSDDMVGSANEYGTDQKGNLSKVGKPNGQLITEERAHTEMVYMVSVIVNRMADGRFGDRVSVIASNSAQMEGYARGARMLENYGKEGGASTARINRARRAIDSVRATGSVLPPNVLYWKAVVQGKRQNRFVRTFRQGIDHERVARTDFSTRN